MGLVIISCSKIDPDDSVYSNPVFRMSGTIDGDSISYVAGENTELSTYHEVEFNRSYLGSSFISLNGEMLLQSDFALEGILGVSGTIEDAVFGSINNTFQLNINEVTNGDYTSAHSWYVNNTLQAQSAQISGNGIYDIRLDIQSYGEFYSLRDKVIIGGTETDEPQILIEDYGQNTFSFHVIDIPEEVDSVAWSIDDGVIGFIPIVDIVTPIELNQERYVVLCEYYQDGVLKNYKSVMFGPYSANPIISMDSLMQHISSSSAPDYTKGQITLEHNGQLYHTKDDYQNTYFEVNDIQPFTEPVTGLEMIKAHLVLETYVYNEVGDSIPLNLNGVIGIQRFPN